MNQPPFLDINDIESRLIILKRRAAEANFLREERDMLLNRLKLYSNEYVWPEKENINSEAQVDDELFNKCKEENERLIQENFILGETVASLEKEINEMEKIKEALEAIKQENECLKNALTKLNLLEEEVQVLMKEKSKLNDDLESVLEIVNSDDPNATCKNQIRILFSRANELRKEKDSLRDLLIEKDLRIDILLGKISHLESRLNGKLISANLKTKLGEELDIDEALIWTVQKLEAANKSMGLDLSELTDKFNSMNKKYHELLMQVKTKGGKSHAVSDHWLVKSPSRETFEQRMLSTKSFQEVDYIISEWATDKELEEDGGSTGPPSSKGSDESLYDRQSDMERDSNLAAMRSTNKAVGNCHLKLTEMKKMVKKEESRLQPIFRRFYAPVQADSFSDSFRMIGSTIYIDETSRMSEEESPNRL